MSEFSAELDGMTPGQMVDRLRTDGDFLGRAVGHVATTHPEVFDQPFSEIYTVEEVAEMLHVTLPKQDN